MSMRQKDIISNLIVESVLRRKSATRQEILRDVPVRPATLFAIIRELASEGILCEPQRKGKKTGRRASPVTINPDFGQFVGLDVDIYATTGVCINAGGEVLAEARRDSSRPKDRELVQAEIKAVVAELRGQMSERWEGVQGIGLADPGLVNPREGLSLKAVNVPGWEQVQSGAWLRKTFGKESVVYPAPTARAYAEALARSPHGPPSLFHMQLDAGIGGGFVKDESLFVGDTCCAMEIGHVVIQEEGPLCQCGNRGCLEALAGREAIRRRVEELNRRGVHTALDAEQFSFSHLISCVHDQDKAACALALDAGECVGAAVATIIAILNPSHIVFTGGLSGLGERLLEPVRRIISQRCFSQVVEQLTLSVSTLPRHATAVGAAQIMRREALIRGVASLIKR